jgi:hypothetical protein
MIYHINVLQDNIFVRFDNEVFHQIVRISMGTNFAPSMVICFYIAMNLNVWLNSKLTCLSQCGN